MSHTILFYSSEGTHEREFGMLSIMDQVGMGRLYTYASKPYMGRLPQYIDHVRNLARLTDLVKKNPSAMEVLDEP